MNHRSGAPQRSHGGFRASDDSLASSLGLIYNEDGSKVEAFAPGEAVEMTTTTAWLTWSLVWGVSCELGESAKAARPNVVIVLTDDQGYGDLSCHGNPVLKTPNLDRLHAESTRLVDFHVDPTCSPTRAALMTGRDSTRVGVWHTIAGRSLLDRRATTLAELFRKAGYATGIFGKWHLGDNAPLRPTDRGFETAVIHGGGGIGQTPDAWGNTYFDDVYQVNDHPTQFQGYCTDVFFAEARRFVVERAAEGRPFFCYLATNAPHAPYRVPQEEVAPYRAAGVKEPQASFYGMIARIDARLGELLEDLNRLDLARDTIMIFMTDNGTAAGDPGGMRGRKGSPYEGGHRVPCFVRWPGRVPANRDVEVISAHVDLLPTLADWCGLSHPAPDSLDGRSLARVLEGQPDAAIPAERTLIVHSQRIETPELWRQSCVLQGRWRLVNRDELYNLADDPLQTRDRAAEHPELVETLQRAYLEWWNTDSLRQAREGVVRFPLGSPTSPATTLTCHDWHGQVVPWNQTMVARDPWNAQGWWAVEVERAGRYRVALRSRPAPHDQGVPLGATSARVACGVCSATIDLKPDDSVAILELDLSAGPQRLETVLTAPDGRTRGAFFVTITRLDPP